MWNNMEEDDPRPMDLPWMPWPNEEFKLPEPWPEDRIDAALTRLLVGPSRSKDALTLLCNGINIACLLVKGKILTQNQIRRHLMRAKGGKYDGTHWDVFTIVEEGKEPRYLTRMYVDEEEKIPDDLEPAWEEAMAKCA